MLLFRESGCTLVVQVSVQDIDDDPRSGSTISATLMSGREVCSLKAESHQCISCVRFHNVVQHAIVRDNIATRQAKLKLLLGESELKANYIIKWPTPMKTIPNPFRCLKRKASQAWDADAFDAF